jgi:molybdate transport system substrate-binding protein
MRRIALLAVAVLALAAPSATSAVSGITVFAAASLTQAFPKIDAAPKYSFAGSDALALQIRNGAPADVFASASPTQPEALYKDGVVLKPRCFATNRLTLIVPRGNPAQIESVFDLRRGGIKLVIGTPTVPIGSYTRQVLSRLGMTAAVLKNVVSQESDVKGIVSKVALGQADAGFVYVTDARPVANDVTKIAIPAWSQPKVRYEIAVVARSSNRAAAQRFVNELLTKRGRRMLASSGFGVPKR